jgi:hypothetical protein
MNDVYPFKRGGMRVVSVQTDFGNYEIITGAYGDGAVNEDFAHRFAPDEWTNLVTQARAIECDQGNW